MMDECLASALVVTLSYLFPPVHVTRVSGVRSGAGPLPNHATPEGQRRGREYHTAVHVPARGKPCRLAHLRCNRRKGTRLNAGGFLMGARGPVPKRSDQRLGHRGKADVAGITRSPASGSVSAPPDPEWHYIAQEWFTALGRSGQSAFYEESDWATARYVAQAMSTNLAAGRFSAQLFAAVMQSTAGLLCTEGDRRRLRIELERGTASDADDDASVSALDRYRDSLGA